MKAPTDPRVIRRLLESFEWMGHVELGDNDMIWLANQLAAAFSQGDLAVCESCGTAQPIVVRTPLGTICEDCLDMFNDQATDIREDLDG